MGLGTSAGGVGPNESGHGPAGSGSGIPLVFGGSSTPGPNASHGSGNSNVTISGVVSSTHVSANGIGSLTIGQLDSGSQAGSGSSSSGTSALGCGDEVVHSIVVSRTGNRTGKSGSSKRSKDHKATRVSIW